MDQLNKAQAAILAACFGVLVIAGLLCLGNCCCPVFHRDAPACKPCPAAKGCKCCGSGAVSYCPCGPDQCDCRPGAKCSHCCSCADMPKPAKPKKPTGASE